MIIQRETADVLGKYVEFENVQNDISFIFTYCYGSF